MSREAMQMALDALEQITPDWRTSIDKHEQLNNSIDALRTALAQPESDPAAWISHNAGLYHGKPDESLNPLPLYTAPPQRKPLSDEAIYAIGKELGLKCLLGGNPNIDIDFARAIEAAHGIKEK